MYNKAYTKSLGTFLNNMVWGKNELGFLLSLFKNDRTCNEMSRHVQISTPNGLCFSIVCSCLMWLSSYKFNFEKKNMQDSCKINLSKEKSINI